MKIYQAIQITEGLRTQTNKRSQIKYLRSLEAVLQSLNEHPLTTDELQLLEEALESILFSTGTEPSIKELKRNRSRFRRFLREEFSLVPKGYYLSLGISLGISFGVAIGTVLQAITGGAIPLGMGIPIGMVIGMNIGIMKDNEAERQNHVLQIKPLA